MALNTDMLESFVQVATHLSVSRAALELGINKSLVSKRIAQLEELVRTTLFSRSTRHIAMTPAGEVYLNYARQALKDALNAQEQLKNLRSDLVGTIRLCAPVSWGQRVLADHLPSFLIMNPRIEIELQLSDRLSDLAQEKFDLGLRWTIKPAHELVCLPIARVEFVICASPDYLSRFDAPMCPADLSQHECIAYWREPSDDKWHFFKKIANSTEISGVRIDQHVRYRLRANDTQVAAKAALAGLGIALLPKYSVASELASGHLVAILNDWTPDTRFGTWIVAQQPFDRAHLARTQALVVHLRDKLSSKLTD